MIQPRSNRGDQSLRTNNSHKPHSKWTSLGIRCTTKADPNTMQKDRSVLHTVQSRAKCVRSRDFRRYRLSHFLCMSEPLSWSGSRSPAEKKYFFALSMTPDNEPAQSISDQILLPGLRITNVPRADIFQGDFAKHTQHGTASSHQPDHQSCCHRSSLLIRRLHSVFRDLFHNMNRAIQIPLFLFL